MEKILNHALHIRHVPFGGTSAGMAILGDIDFSAQYASPSDPEGLVSAEDVMKDPTAAFVDILRGFITPDYLQNVVTDTHFTQRQRQGRLIGFMAKAVFNRYQNIDAFSIRGIGADEETAVCFGNNGEAKVFGTNSVYFLMGHSLIERILRGHSLDWYGQKEAIQVYAIHGSQYQQASFDLKTWSGSGGLQKYWFVDGTNPFAPTFGEK